jgi:hypothetical protein
MNGLPRVLVRNTLEIKGVKQGRMGVRVAHIAASLYLDLAEVLLRRYHPLLGFLRRYLTTSCQWPKLPVERDAHDQPVMSYQVPYYHFRKWSKDGSLQRLFDASILTITGELNLSELNLDGSHSAAKKGAKKLPIKDERRPKPAISCP